MLEILFLLVATMVVPVLINKSTEGERFNFVKPWLRELWTGVFVFISCYALLKPEARETAMRWHSAMPGFRGYLIASLVGAVGVSLYWYFTGIITPSESGGGNKPHLISPTITWDQPASISQGTPLSVNQLNATIDIDATPVYDPGVGTILGEGKHKLSVKFTPKDSTKYLEASKTTDIVVVKPRTHRAPDPQKPPTQSVQTVPQTSPQTSTSTTTKPPPAPVQAETQQQAQYIDPDKRTGTEWDIEIHAMARALDGKAVHIVVSDPEEEDVAVLTLYRIIGRSSELRYFDLSKNKMDNHPLPTPGGNDADMPIPNHDGILVHCENQKIAEDIRTALSGWFYAKTTSAPMPPYIIEKSRSLDISEPIRTLVWIEFGKGKNLR